MSKIPGRLFLTSLAIFLMIACSKTGGSNGPDAPIQIDENDNVFPMISFLKPSVNQIFTSGDSIIIEGKVTDNKVLYKGKVYLKNEATSATVAEQTYETHFLQIINFRLAYKAVVSASTEFSVNVEFQDHGLNNSTETFKVKVNP